MGASASLAIKRVGFVGLGNMGFPMASRLVVAGFEVIPFDARPERTDEFTRRHGVAAAATLRDLGHRCDAVITMLPDGDVVRKVMLEGGIVDGLRAGAVVVDMSTSSPIDTRGLGEALAERGLQMLDAPVAGGVPFAEQGRLTVTVGGALAEIERCRALFGELAERVVVCGPLGAGHTIKALNNFVNASALTTMIEALVIGRRYGVEVVALVDAMAAATTGDNHPLEKKIKPHILTRRFATSMPAGLIAKDVGIALELARASRTDAPCTALTAELWRKAVDVLGPDADQTEIVRLWEEPAGVELTAVGPETGNQTARVGEPRL